MGSDSDEFDELEDPTGIDLWEAIKRRMPPPTPTEQAVLDDFFSKIRTPLRTGDPRRHHFIPEFFQKRFADEKERLAVVPLGGGRPRFRHVSRNAVQTDLYTYIDEEVGETAALERLLAEVDGAAATAIRQLSEEDAQLGSADRFALATWLALLQVRDPFTRRRMEAVADHTFKLDFSLASSEDVARTRLRVQFGREPTDAEVAELVDAAQHLEGVEITPHQNSLIKTMLDGAMAMAPHLLARRLSVMTFGEPGLILPDRPIVLEQRPENRMPFMGVGIINADELWLPLDRRTLLVLHHDENVEERRHPGQATLIDSCNQRLALNAEAEIYCHGDDLERIAALTLPERKRPLIMVDGGGWMTASTDGVNAPAKRERHRRYRGGERDS